MKSKVCKQRICHKTKTICFTKCEGLAFVDYIQLENEVILYLFMKLIHLLKIFLRNTTNPNMNVTEFFQPHHSKVTFPFLQSSQFQNFPTLYNKEIFRKF